ncbi:hypothetical protein XA68_17735 [Ophiocordyceps unilateralis]|uniref:Adhesin-like protein 2 n=1 Tax=Ophiocordyceps unilateralis TaxID=268505 RepID=A0A2A9P4D1_OPHUN|nr:hypothetical protein XA68_17735 [Ophiocordyceps unilateralis]
MKSSVIAVAASAAAVASAALVPRSPLLGLGLDTKIDVLGIKADICLNVKIPEGIHMDEADCPKHGPPADCTDMWHPPHDVTIDGCDNHGETEWHYVHPCNCEDQAPHSWTTSTVTATQMVTTINNVQTTYAVPATTTVCPVPVANTAVVETTPMEQPMAPVQTAEYQPTSIYTPTPVNMPSATYQAPPVNAAPSQQAYVAPAAPAPAPYPTYAPSVVPAPAPAPVVPYAAPIGTAPGYTPRPYSNTTAPVVMAGASSNGRNVLAAAVVVVAAALLL